MYVDFINRSLGFGLDLVASSGQCRRIEPWPQKPIGPILLPFHLAGKTIAVAAHAARLCKQKTRRQLLQAGGTQIVQVGET
jgi:hypothetical protein